MTFGSLFAGIGGMDLGLERAGMQCRWQVEIDPFARRVLAKHWPDVRRHDDVRTFPPEPTEDWTVDLIAGGFPCQPVSLAGRRKGQDDPRWLWPEFARVLRDLRPRFALLENVPGLLVRGFGDVLGDLAALGFDAEWSVLPASFFGARHLRARLFVVAHSKRGGRDGLHEREQTGCVAPHPRLGSAHGPGRRTAPDPAAAIANPDRQGLAVGEVFRFDPRQEREAAERGCGAGWLSEPDVGRVADGVPSRVDRLRCLGNAVVPQKAEWIGRRLMEAVR